MHRAPPAKASAAGLSPNQSQPMRIASGGTRYVVEPIRPALVDDSAYAHVVNAIAVGKTPR